MLVFLASHLTLQDEGCWKVEAQDFDDMGLDNEIQAHMHKITFTGI